VHPGDPWPQSRIDAERQVWKTLGSIPAVRNGRIYELVDDRLSIPGPRVAEAVRILADALRRVKSAEGPVRYTNSTATLDGIRRF
jgi:ABC-type Fe3+-hydroxamate transport system substrate-binding protein